MKMWANCAFWNQPDRTAQVRLRVRETCAGVQVWAQDRPRRVNSR